MVTVLEQVEEQVETEVGHAEDQAEDAEAPPSGHLDDGHRDVAQASRKSNMPLARSGRG
jgi:hypothetical protein